MLRTAQSLPLQGPSTLGFDPTRFQTEPPVCYRASWQLPGPDSHRQATTSLRTKNQPPTRSTSALLGARKRLNVVDLSGDELQQYVRLQDDHSTYLSITESLERSFW